MMQSNYIELKKKREIGDIITETFKFLRKNLKPLFSVLSKTILIPYILLIGGIILYSIGTNGSSDSIRFIENISSNIGLLIIGILALGVTGVIYNGLLYGSISEYIKEYEVSKGTPNKETIIKNVKKKTSKYIQLSFLNLLYVFVIPLIGFILGGVCIGIGGAVVALGIFIILGALIYAIYAYTKYIVVFPVFVNNNTSSHNSFSNSGKLVKDEWWMTFLALFLLSLIIGTISFIFQFPATVYTLSKDFVTSEEFSYIDPSIDWLLVVLQTLASSVSYLLYVIAAVATNFIYYNLNERKNQTGSLELINTIGGSDEE